MSDEVKIPISLPGAAQASQDAAKVAAGLDKVAGSAKQGGKAAEDQAKGAAEAGKQILSLGETTEKGIGIGRMFSEALNGNLYALLNVTAALKVTGAAIKTSLVGMLLLGLTALAQFLPTLIEKLSGKKDSLADGFDAAREAGEKLNAEKLSALQATLETIKDRASAVRAELDLVQAAADKLDDAKMAAAIAINNADPNLTPEDKARREIDIRGNAAATRRNRKIERMAADEKIAKEETDKLASVALIKAEELTSAFNNVESAKARRQQLAEEKRGLEIEHGNLSRTPGITTEERARSGRRQLEIETRQRALKIEEKSINDPYFIEKEVQARLDLKARKGDFSTAEKALSVGMTGYDALRGKNSIECSFMRDEEEANSKKQDAERWGIVPGFQPVYSPNAPTIENRVRDSGSLRSGAAGDAIAATIAAAAEARIREGEKAIADAVARRLVADRSYMERLADQIRNGREGK